MHPVPIPLHGINTSLFLQTPVLHLPYLRFHRMLSKNSRRLLIRVLPVQVRYHQPDLGFWRWKYLEPARSCSYLYQCAGIYSVTLKAVNNAGCQKTVTRSNIIRLQNPHADFSFSGSTGCNATSTINFTELSRQELLPVTWYFGDGSNSLLANPLHTYALPGTYDIKLVVTGA
jgi:PKD repeat protein